MRVMGIDPGKYGAIAIMDFAFANIGAEVTFFDIPLVKIPTKQKTKSGNKKIKTEYDIVEINLIIRSFKNVNCVFIEKVHAMPSQGSVSMLSIGLGFGMYEGILVANEMNYQKISAKEWQKYFGISGKLGDTKEQAHKIALKLFPSTADKLITSRGRILDGRSDALLIAAYGAKVRVDYWKD